MHLNLLVKFVMQNIVVSNAANNNDIIMSLPVHLRSVPVAQEWTLARRRSCQRGVLLDRN